MAALEKIQDAVNAAIAERDRDAFDPLDLAILSAEIGGYYAKLSGRFWDVSLNDAEELVSLARMLHRLWLEIDGDLWSAVFAYDVTSPMAIRIALRMYKNGERLQTLRTFAEEAARELIASAQV